MKLISTVVERLTDRVIGHVDAGACVVGHGCCCMGASHPHYYLTCTGSCQRNTSVRCTGSCPVY